VQFQLLVADVTTGWLCFYCKGKPLLKCRIQRDDSYVEALLERAMDFIMMVKNDIEPEKDPERDILIPSSDLERWDECAARYCQVKRQIEPLEATLKQLAKEEKSVKKELTELLGAFHKGKYSGVQVTKTVRSDVVDWKAVCSALCESHGITLKDSDLAEFSRPGAVSIRVTASKEAISSLGVTDSVIPDTPATLPPQAQQGEVRSFFF